jgi:hypothetical protein
MRSGLNYTNPTRKHQSGSQTSKSSCVGLGIDLQGRDHEHDDSLCEPMSKRRRISSDSNAFGRFRSSASYAHHESRVPITRPRPEELLCCHPASHPCLMFPARHGMTPRTDINKRHPSTPKRTSPEPESHVSSHDVLPSIRPSTQSTCSTFLGTPGQVDDDSVRTTNRTSANQSHKRSFSQLTTDWCTPASNGTVAIREERLGKSMQQTPSIAFRADKRIPGFYKPDVFRDLFQRRVFKALPGKAECRALLGVYFRHFNQLVPLFNEESFMELIDNASTPTPYKSSGLWASINVALAIASSVATDTSGRPPDSEAWGYLKNALAVTNELTMYNVDLMSIQALLGMALFFRGTSNPQPSFSLLSAAIRLSHTIKLHRKCNHSAVSAEENEQRKRVFWVAYFLDKETSLRSGRPSAQDDADIDIELPSEDPADKIGLVLLNSADDGIGKPSSNVFRSICAFAQIQSRVYKKLYSVKASRKSEQKLLATINKLVAELEDWKLSIPTDFRPGHEIDAACWPYRLHVIFMNLAYHHCVATIHRLSVHGDRAKRSHTQAMYSLDVKSADARVSNSSALCLQSARASIRLVRCISRDDFDCVWVLMYYPVSALVMLFVNILRDPRASSAWTDLGLISSMVDFVARLEYNSVGENNYIRRMHSVCAGYERAARALLHRAEASSKD